MLNVLVYDIRLKSDEADAPTCRTIALQTYIHIYPLAKYQAKLAYHVAPKVCGAYSLPCLPISLLVPRIEMPLKKMPLNNAQKCIQ